MSFSLSHIILIFSLYLLALFALAHASSRGKLPAALVNHPAVYVLSLGAFSSAWIYYGMLDLSLSYGYSSLMFFMGIGAVFLFSPLLLGPLLRLSQLYKLRTLADIFTFRFFSRGVGSLATLVITFATIPLFALQVMAVSDTAQILNLYTNLDAIHLPTFTWQDSVAPIYCTLIMVFTLMFGVKGGHQQTITVVMAFDSAVKITAFLAVGLFAIYGVFGGFGELESWLAQQPEQLQILNGPQDNSGAHWLTFLGLGAILCFPQLLQITNAKQSPQQIVNTVSWSALLLLLLMAFPIFPMLWAGFKLGLPLPAEYFTLGLPIFGGNTTLSIIAFLGGLSAATIAVIAMTMALTRLIINHWLAPNAHLGHSEDIYRWLHHVRRSLGVLIPLAGYLVYLMATPQASQQTLAITGFVGAAQLLPLIIVTPYWNKASAKGASYALGSSFSVWLLALFVPLLFDIQAYNLGGWQLPVGIEHWPEIMTLCFGLNLGLLISASLLFPGNEKEQQMAKLCSMRELNHPLRLELELNSSDEFVTQLSTALGKKSAQQEVARAMKELQLTAPEVRPYALRRLRDQLLANLSGLMGPAVAYTIIERCIPFHHPESTTGSDIQFIESRLEAYRSQMTGLTAELDNLRLYHRRTLEDLPMATCSLGNDKEILMWNHAMETLTGIPAEAVSGSRIDTLAPPWGEVLGKFSRDALFHIPKEEIKLQNQSLWVGLHKANIEGLRHQQNNAQVILLEDITDGHMLEQKLVHSERLASIGRLAAGVAHEIGNPVTGIACLAQNMRYETDNPELLESVEQIMGETKRVKHILQSLLNFSHQGKQDAEEHIAVGVQQCTIDAIRLLLLQKDAKPVQFRNLVSDEIYVMGDPQKLVQVLVNLLSNSRDASPENSTVTVSADVNATTVSISVVDEGSGLPPHIQKQVFEPFFTTKDPGKGTGLGLALVYSIIEEHYGEIEILSPVAAEGGTNITLKLPRQLETLDAAGHTGNLL